MDNSVLKIGNLKISPEKYQEWLKKLTGWFNNSGRAEETLERHLDNIQRLYNEGGILYRLMFLENGETIDKNNLGQHWVADENVLADIRSMLLDTAKAEKDPKYEYTITIKIPSKNINIHDSIAGFLENPNEEEIYLNNTRNAKIQDIQKEPLAEMIIRRRLAKLTESFDFISGLDTVNMKDYAKAAIRDIFIQMPSRSVNLNNWNGYKNYVEGFFGKDSYKVAMRELKNDGWLTKGETRYEWKKMFGPIGTTPQKDHLNEWADEINVKGKHTVLDYTDMDAYPFIFDIKENKVHIGAAGESHGGSIDIEAYWKAGGGIAGRIWTDEKIISFWEYPDNVAMYKNLIVQLNKAIVIINRDEAENIPKVTPSWKLDIPYTKIDLNTPRNFFTKMGELEKIEKVGKFRDVQSTFIPIFDWTPEVTRNAKGYFQQMQKRRQQHVVSPIAKATTDTQGIGSRKTPGGLSSTQRHQMKSTSEIKEWADRVKYTDKKNKFHNIAYTEKDAIPFGYDEDEDDIIIQRPGTPHHEVDTYRGDYPGRFWYKSKIISFWKYPETKSKLYKIIKDLNNGLKAVNWYEGTNIDKSWRVDVPKLKKNIKTFDMDKALDYKIESDLVPINDWHPDMIRKAVGFKKALKKQQQMHMLSPMAKKAIGMKGVGSRKTPADLSITQRHQMKSTSEQTMNEHPDRIDTKKVYAHYSDDDAFAFGYYRGVLYASDETHRNTWVKTNNNDIDKGIPRKNFRYGGRIWIKNNIITFWEYPEDSNTMKQICDELSHWFKYEWENQEDNVDADSVKKFLGKDYDIWNTFRVEIIVNDEGIIKTDVEYDVWNKVENVKNHKSKIIPVKDYQSSEERSSEELGLQHILSPMKKSGQKLPSSAGSEKTLAGLTPTQYHQLRSTSESADVFTHPDTGNRIYYDFGGVAFGYIDNAMEISKYNGIHGDIVNGIYNKNGIVYTGNARDAFNFPGRIWPSEEVISFWKYPKDKNELYKIIQDLEKVLKIKINFDYRIEINEDGEYKFINIDDFQGSNEIPMSDLKSGHMLSPVYKTYTDVPPGWGSRKTPSGVSSTQRHQMKFTSENIDEWADTIDYIDKNDKKQQLYYLDADAVPFGYKEKTDKLKVGVSGESHGSSGIEPRQDKYVGRIWTQAKVISFWEYPETKSKLNKIIKDLNVKLTKAKITNNWKIDVPNLTKNINSFKILPNQSGIKKAEKVRRIYGVDSTLIPIKDWHPDMISKAADFTDEMERQQQMHMLSPIAKSVTGEKGIGSRKIPAGLSATQRHQLKSTSENIDEWADEAIVGMKKLEYDDTDAYAFGFDDNTKEFKVSDWGQTHGAIGANDYNDNYMRGRYWTRSKLLAFWVYPKDQTDMQRLIKLINDDVGMKLINNTWKVEIPLQDRSIFNPLGNKARGINRSDSMTIPIGDFDSNIIKNPMEWKKQAKKQLKLHMLSPIAKQTQTDKGIGSKKTPAGLSATQRHQMTSTSENKIKESPDWVYDDAGEKIGNWSWDDAYPFGYYKNRMVMSKKSGEAHSDVMVGKTSLERDEFKFGGRVWFNNKIISFWEYPKNNSQMKKIAKDLSSIIKRKLGKNVDIWNDFSVDIIVKRNGPETQYTSDVEWDGAESPVGYDTKIIKVKDFNTSGERPEAELSKPHVKSPMQKVNVPVAKGIGSKRRPAGMTSTQRHQMRSTSENKLNEIKTEYGCLMLKIDFPWWRNFIEKYIKEDDIYDNAAHDYGLEYETHVTVLYGFNEGIDVEKMEKMLYTLKNPISIKLTKIDTFNQKELDVVKFHVESKTLENLNKIVKQNFDYTEIYKNYDAHMTIAYVKPGTAEKYIGNLKMPISVSSSTFVYSYPGGRKKVFNFLQKKQMNS